MVKIGVFDSGLGGLSVLRVLLKELPNEEYIYYADSAHCPYGKKSKEYITNRAETICNLLMEEGCNLVVIACNTATSAAITYLREKYPISFIGMEPAIKPAALHSKNKKIGVLATSATLNGLKYKEMKKKYESVVEIYEEIGEGFVTLVEDGIIGLDSDNEEIRNKVDDVVKKSLLPLLEADVDTIVLGCTHYPFLIDSMRRIAYKYNPIKNVEFIDPAPAIVHQVYRVINNRISDEHKDSYISNEHKDSYISNEHKDMDNYKKEPSLKLLSSGSISKLESLFSLLCK